MPRYQRAARLTVRLVAGAALLSAALYAAVYWVEAEKEVRILCGLSGAGTPAAEVDRLYGTANLLTLARDTETAPQTLMALVAFGGLTLLQLALAAGAPLGRLAWGGAHERLPAGLRAASGAVALVCLAGMASVAIVAGWIAWPAAAPVAEGVLGVLTVVLLLSYLANPASSSVHERWLGSTLALLLVVRGVVLLLGS